jgi:hypothetical protein
MDTGLYLIREEFYPTDLLQPVLRNFSILEVIKKTAKQLLFHENQSLENKQQQQQKTVCVSWGIPIMDTQDLVTCGLFSLVVYFLLSCL